MCFTHSPRFKPWAINGIQTIRNGFNHFEQSQHHQSPTSAYRCPIGQRLFFDSAEYHQILRCGLCGLSAIFGRAFHHKTVFGTRNPAFWVGAVSGSFFCGHCQ
jgi:hypothetical protein